MSGKLPALTGSSVTAAWIESSSGAYCSETVAPNKVVAAGPDSKFTNRKFQETSETNLEVLDVGLDRNVARRVGVIRC